MKSVKPHAASYKLFKDDSKWIKAKESYDEVLDAQSLAQCVDPSYVPQDPELDKRQRKRLYATFKECMQASTAKSTVTKHKDSKDIRSVWTETWDTHAKSTSAELAGQGLSAHITGTKCEQVGWRGSCQGHVMNFKEQCRLHNEIAKQSFTDEQLSQLLSSAAPNVDRLAQVLTTSRVARKAAGNHSTFTFEECVQDLCDAAQVKDNSSSNALGVSL